MLSTKAWWLLSENAAAIFTICPSKMLFMKLFCKWCSEEKSVHFSQDIVKTSHKDYHCWFIYRIFPDILIKLLCYSLRSGFAGGYTVKCLRVACFSTANYRCEWSWGWSRQLVFTRLWRSANQPVFVQAFWWISTVEVNNSLTDNFTSFLCQFVYLCKKDESSQWIGSPTRYM